MRAVKIPTEAHRAVAFFVLAFFAMGIPRLYTNAAAFTLFLETFDAALIPYTYIGTAILVPTVGYAYLKLETRLTLSSLFVVFLLFDVVVLLGVWMVLQFETPGWSVWLITVWVESEWAISSLVFWGLAERAFNVREAKRWFGVAVAGEPLGAIAGGLLLPVLLNSVAVKDLLLVSVGGIAVGLIVALFIARSMSEEEGVEEQVGHAGEASLWPVRRYLTFIFALSIISVVVHFIIDNAFYEQLESHFVDQDEIASFIGRFFTVVGVVTLFSNLFLARHVLNRHGMRTALLTLPVMLASVGTSILVSGWYYQSIAAVLWLVCAAKLIDEAIRWGIFWPSFMVLYQPLSPRQRTRAQAVNEGFVDQVAAIIGGVLLLLLAAMVGFDAIQMFALVVFLIGPWLWLSMSAQKRYVQMIRQALSLRRLNPSRFTADSEESLTVLRQGLGGSHPTDRIYCLHQLVMAEAVTEGQIRDLLGDSDPLVRRETAIVIEKVGFSTMTAILRASLRVEDDTPAKCAMLRALARIEPHDSVVTLAAHLQGSDGALKFAAMVALLKHCGPAGMTVAGKALKAMARSQNTSKRAMAARVFTDVKPPSLNDELCQLINDEDAGVRNAALRAVTIEPSSSYIEPLLRNLEADVSKSQTVQACVALGSSIVPTIQKLVSHSDTAKRCKLQCIRILRGIGDRTCVRELEQLWRVAPSELETEIVRALIDLSYQPDEQAKRWALDRLSILLKQAAALLSYESEMSGVPECASIVQALRNDLNSLRHLVYAICCLLDESIQSVYDWSSVTADGSEKTAYAVELVTQGLAAKHRDQVAAFLESSVNPARARQLSRAKRVKPEDIDARLAYLLSEAGEVSPWVRACAAQCAGKRHWGSERIELLVTLLGSPIDSVREAAVWSICRLAPEALMPWLETLRTDTLASIRNLIRHHPSVFRESDEMPR